MLKVEPTRQAIEEMDVTCWVTGLRCTEGRTRTDFQEVEQRDKGLIKLNPILIWYEREVWQYLALNEVPVNPLYAAGLPLARLLPRAPHRQRARRARRPLDRHEQVRRRVRHPHQTPYRSVKGAKKCARKHLIMTAAFNMRSEYSASIRRDRQGCLCKG